MLGTVICAPVPVNVPPDNMLYPPVLRVMLGFMVMLPVAFTSLVSVVTRAV